MAKVITHYTLVTAVTSTELVAKVEQLIGEGWLPYFGPYTYGQTIALCHAQAMVLKDEEEE